MYPMTFEEYLMATLRQDFSKYSEHADKRCLYAVFNSEARKTRAQIKYAHLADDFANPTLKKAFERQSSLHLKSHFLIWQITTS
jgi:hypothetical protein